MGFLLLQQLREQETRLRESRASRLERIRAFLHGSNDPARRALANHLDQVSDWIEAEANIFTDADIALLGHELAALRDIDAALRRIADGSYGTCTVCGEPIDLGRLEAEPAARICSACKDAFEKRRGFVHGRI